MDSPTVRVEVEDNSPQTKPSFEELEKARVEEIRNEDLQDEPGSTPRNQKKTKARKASIMFKGENPVMVQWERLDADFGPDAHLGEVGTEGKGGGARGDTLVTTLAVRDLPKGSAVVKGSKEWFEEQYPPLPSGMTLRPLKCYGKYETDQMAGIIREWKRNPDSKANIHPFYIKKLVDYEFEDVSEPDMKDLLDSVFRLPVPKKVAKKRWAPKYNKLTGQPELLPKSEWPTVDVTTGLSYGDKGLAFDVGQWCEFLGNDMQWHLAPVRRIVKMAPPDYEGLEDDDEVEFEYYYSIGSSALTDPKDVRASEEALKRVFGMGPWLWQQWACLQLETFTRFQEGHDRDFANANFLKVTRDLWKYWLNHEKNQKFKKLFDEIDGPDGFFEVERNRVRKSVGCADKLTTHILSPFRIMDEIAKNKNGKYTLVDDVSIFTYVSFMGSGWVTVFVTIIIQLLVPGILLVSAVTQYAGPNRFNETDLTLTTWSEFCHTSQDRNVLGKLMNIIVLLLYTIRVLPNLLYELYSTSGEDDTGSSKMDEVRRQVFESGDDTLFMQMGYKIDIYMNGVYVCILMTDMLFILFITDDIFSIILNALALEFVSSLDEELATGDWFDAGGRYITCAAAEMQLRCTTNLEAMENASKFRKAFGIHEEQWIKAMCLAAADVVNDLGTPITPEEYDEAVRLQSGPIFTRIRARRHAYRDMCVYDKKLGPTCLRDPAWMSKDARFNAMCSSYAEHVHNKAALWQFEETREQFGIVDQILILWGWTSTGMFARLQEYCTWNRWSKVLYLCEVPEIGKYFDSDLLMSVRKHKEELLRIKQGEGRGAGDKVSLGSGKLGGALKSVMTQASAGVSSHISSHESIFSEWVMLLKGGKTNNGFLNFDQKDFDLTPFQRFIELLKDKVLLKGVFKSVGTAVRRNDYHEIPIRLIDGMIDWFSICYQLSFAFILVFFGYLVIFCY